MKILLVNKFFFPKGGAETVFFQEREFLRRSGHDVVDFSMRHPANIPSPYKDYFIPQIDYRNLDPRLFPKILQRIRIAGSFIHNHRAAGNLARLIEKERPQVAHLHNVYHQLTPSIIHVLHRFGIKIVLTLHDYKIVCPNYLMLTNGHICRRCEGWKFWNAFLRRCENGSLSGSLLLAAEAMWHRVAGSYGKVDVFLAPSQFMVDTVRRYRPDVKRIRRLANGIDPQYYQASEIDEGYALYFGRISQEKGIGTFLDAHERANIPIPAKVVGTGDLEDELQHRFPWADFVGFKQGEELRELVRRASFIVVPSEWYENCSMTVLEAMALGKPVIGSRIGGIPEQVEDGHNGFLFTPGDVSDLAEKLTLLARDSALRRTMGRAGRQKLEREYSLEHHCKQLLALYHSLLDTGIR